VLWRFIVPRSTSCLNRSFPHRGNVSFSLSILTILSSLVGVGIASSIAVSAVMSRNQWDGIARELLIRRRSFQGLLVRSGEVEFLRAILPEALLAFLLLTIVVLYLVRKKLRYCSCLDREINSWRTAE
jgi:hypothetical protein